MRKKILGATVVLVGVSLVVLLSFGWGRKPTLWTLYETQIKPAKIVDLTHTFGPETPIWEGFGHMKVSPTINPQTGKPYTWGKDAFVATHYELMAGHCGTHVGPPAHFNPKGITLDEVPVTWMIRPLVVIDIHDKVAKYGWKYQATVDDIKEWENKYGKIPEGSIVMLRTDISKLWDAGKYDEFSRYPFPGWTKEAVMFLHEQRHVIAQGHESMDTDTTSTCEAEDWLFDHNYIQFEVVDNLWKVPEAGALIIAMWPKAKHATGFPVRIIALCPPDWEYGKTIKDAPLVLPERATPWPKHPALVK